MSGGHWDYLQYRLTDIIDDIKDESEGYPEEVIAEFKKGAEQIAKAQIYMQRIDWLLSGDDGEESFLKRLKEDLDEYVSTE